MSVEVTQMISGINMEKKGGVKSGAEAQKRKKEVLGFNMEHVGGACQSAGALCDVTSLVLKRNTQWKVEQKRGWM